MDEKDPKENSTVTAEPTPANEVPVQDVEEDEPRVELFPGASSWLTAGSSWLNSAKKKTINTFDLMKKDLSEFKDAMSSEVSELASAAKDGLDNTVNVVKQQAQYLEELVTPEEEEKTLPAESETNPEDKSSTAQTDDILTKVERSASMGFGWMKSIVDTVADTVKNLAIEETAQGEENFTEAIRPVGGRNLKINKIKINQIQTNEATYLTAPSDSETFGTWMSRFSIEEHDGEINLLLANNPPLRQIYSKLVPTTIDSATFWSRYFFAVEMAELDAEMNESFTLKELTIKSADAEKEGKQTVLSKEAKHSPEPDVAVIEQPTSPAKSTDDWSVCSEKNEVEEVCSSGSTQSEEDANGPLTPKVKDADEKKDKRREEGDDWVDWDE